MLRTVSITKNGVSCSFCSEGVIRKIPSFELNNSKYYNISRPKNHNFDTDFELGGDFITDNSRANVYLIR